MREIIQRYSMLKQEKGFYWRLLVGFVFFAASVYFSSVASIYTYNHASGAVNDIILDNIPVLNVEWLFISAYPVFTLLLLILALYKPKRFPYLLKSIALFIFVRSFFVILTHLSAPLGQISMHKDNLLLKLTSGDDLFFSGHTGFPFLMALVFWDYVYLRIFFLATSIIFGAGVLLGHLHYSIDVFSAFFITYGIYILSLKFFKKDHNSFLNA